jgi:hypothetical protein
MHRVYPSIFGEIKKRRKTMAETFVDEKEYAYDHPRLGLVYVHEIRPYPKSFQQGGAWLHRNGTVTVFVDASIEDPETEAIDQINAAENDVPPKKDTELK